MELSQRARSPLFRFLSPSSLYGSGPCPTVAWPQPVSGVRAVACGLWGGAKVRPMLGGAVLGGAVGLTATTELAALLHAVIGAAAGGGRCPGR
ncbi:MAG: hypothetical protein ACLTDR_04795 [Adlercreutzia equolifaciens]